MPLPSPLPHEPEQAPILGQIAVQGGGLDRFGVSTQLAVVQQVALGLAANYAKEYGFTEAEFRADPEVTILCTGLALARQAEFLLHQTVQRDLAERAEVLDGDYGAALFAASRNETHLKHQKDVDKMHIRAQRYRAELKDLAEQRARSRPPLSATDPRLS